MTALARGSIFQDIMSPRNDMDSLFNAFFRQAASEKGPGLAGMWTPPVDVYETDEAFILKADLPGYSKDDIWVELQVNRLIL
jgi:HSP20 family protein